MLDASIKKELLKEAGARVGLRKSASQSKRDHSDFKKHLLREADIKSLKLRRRAAIEKASMSYHIGQNEFANSNVRWQKVQTTANMDKIDQQLIAAFRPHFYGLLEGKRIPIESPDLVLRYQAYREIIPVPVKGNEQSQQDHKNAIDAIATVNGFVSGFHEFIDAMNNGALPNVLYFHTSLRSKKDGGFSAEDVRDFIESEVSRYQQEPMVSHGKPISDMFYVDHLGEDVRPTEQGRSHRRYDLASMDRETSPSKILRWIQFATQRGFKLDLKAVENDIRQILQDAYERQGLTDPNNAMQEDQRKMLEAYYVGLKPNGKLKKTSVLARMMRLNNVGITKLIDSMEGSGKHKTCPLFDISELRIIGKNMVGQHPEITPGTYTVPHETTTYRANGFDSQKDDELSTMHVLPAMKKLPTGQMVYDRDQGNFMGNQCRTYGKDMVEFMRQWGVWADNAIKHLNSSKADTSFEGSDVVSDAWNAVFDNRTNAENILDLLRQYPDYDSFYANVIQKTMASTITNFNKYDGMSSGEFTIAPFSAGDDLLPRIQEYVKQFNTAVGQKKASIDPNDKDQIKELNDQAIADIDQVAAILTKSVKSEAISWDEYTQCLSALSGAQKTTGAPVKKFHSMSRTDNTQKLNADGFEWLKAYGYQISKMMDFVSALMVRSCRSNAENRVAKDGSVIDEERFGTNYSSGTGKAGSTKMMIGVRYAFRADELGAKDPELNAALRRQRRRQKMNQQSGADIVPQTEHPERGTPVGDDWQDDQFVTAKILENITYYVGQASSSQQFHKALNEGGTVGDMSWRQAVDFFRRKYPELEAQLGVVFEPLNIDMKRLQEATKRAMLAVTQELADRSADVEAVFEDQEGFRTHISPDEVQSDYTLASQQSTANEAAQIDTVEDPDEAERIRAAEEIAPQAPTAEATPEAWDEPYSFDEEFEELGRQTGTMEEPVTEEAVPEPPFETDDAADLPPEEEVIEPKPEPTVRHNITGKILQLDDLAEEMGNEPARDQIQIVEIQHRQGVMTDEEAMDGLLAIEEDIMSAKHEEEDATGAMIELWDEKIRNNDLVPSDINRLDALLPRLENYVKVRGMQLPQSILDYIEENRRIDEEMAQYTGTWDNEDDTAFYQEHKPDAMLQKDMPVSGDVGFIGKKPKGRKLMVNRPDPNTGRLRPAEVIDTLLKTATKLDESGEYVVASKIDLLIKQITEGKDV